MNQESKEKFVFPSKGFYLVADKAGEADYFLERMKENQLDIQSFGYLFSAFVSASRSITFVLQSVMSNYPNFDNWYSPHQETLKSNELAKYFVGLRNEALKTGRSPISHYGSYIDGEMKTSQVFIETKYLKGKPEGYLLELCINYLKDVLKVLKACYLDYSVYVNPRAIFTSEGLSELGWTIEDLEESLGLPRGCTDIPEDSPEKNKNRLSILSGNGGDEIMEQYFEKYSI
jgi:hypothetical protein